MTGLEMLIIACLAFMAGVIVGRKMKWDHEYDKEGE